MVILRSGSRFLWQPLVYQFLSRCYYLPREHLLRLAIFLSRFLFSALGGVINLLSGSELYPYRYFLLFDTSGEALGAIIPLMLGYIFGASWEAVGDVFGYCSFLILCLLVVILLVTRL